MSKSITLGLLLAFGLLVSSWPNMINVQAADTPRFDALVFSFTPYTFHPNQAGINAIQQLGAEHNFNVVTRNDMAVFDNYDFLAQFEVIIFNNACMNNVFTDNQWAVFQQYIRSGGGYVGIHCATDAEYGNDWYGGLVGARFLMHPAVQTATLRIEDPFHPSTQGLPKQWIRTDEWYNFQTNPRNQVHVLITIDETTYSPGTGAMGEDHPMAWCQLYDGGRSFYTQSGHTVETFQEPLFLQHLLGGIEWAAGVAPGNCEPNTTYYQTYFSVIMR